MEAEEQGKTRRPDSIATVNDVTWMWGGVGWSTIHACGLLHCQSHFQMSSWLTHWQDLLPKCRQGIGIYSWVKPPTHIRTTPFTWSLKSSLPCSFAFVCIIVNINRKEEKQNEAMCNFHLHVRTWPYHCATTHWWCHHHTSGLRKRDSGCWTSPSSTTLHPHVFSNTSKCAGSLGSPSPNVFRQYRRNREWGRLVLWWFLSLLARRRRGAFNTWKVHVSVGEDHNRQLY